MLITRRGAGFLLCSRLTWHQVSSDRVGCILTQGGEPASSNLASGNVFAEKLPGCALGALVGLTLSKVQPKLFMH